MPEEKKTDIKPMGESVREQIAANPLTSALGLEFGFLAAGLAFIDGVWAPISVGTPPLSNLAKLGRNTVEALRSRLPSFGKGAAASAEASTATVGETGATLSTEAAGETLLGAAVESGAEVGATVGAAGGFEVPVWGWIATGVAAAGGVGYGVYKHYHSKHEADRAAHKQGFKDSALALDAAKSGFKNSGELHFVDEQIKNARLGNDLHDYAQKHGHNTLEDFMKTSGHKAGHDYARSWGYQTPGERAESKKEQAALAVVQTPEAVANMEQERQDIRAAEVKRHTIRSVHPVTSEKPVHRRFHLSENIVLEAKPKNVETEATIPPPDLGIVATSAFSEGSPALSVLTLLPLVPKSAPYRTALGANLANDGKGRVSSAAAEQGNVKITQRDDNKGNHIAVVKINDHGHHIVDTSVTSSEGARTTHSVDGKMMWSIVKLNDLNGSEIVASNQGRNGQGKLVEHASSKMADSRRGKGIDFPAM